MDAVEYEKGFKVECSLDATWRYNLGIFFYLDYFKCDRNRHEIAKICHIVEEDRHEIAEDFHEMI